MASSNEDAPVIEYSAHLDTVQLVESNLNNKTRSSSYGSVQFPQHAQFNFTLGPKPDSIFKKLVPGIALSLALVSCSIAFLVLSASNPNIPWSYFLWLPILPAGSITYLVSIYFDFVTYKKKQNKIINFLLGALYFSHCAILTVELLFTSWPPSEADFETLTALILAVVVILLSAAFGTVHCVYACYI